MTHPTTQSTAPDAAARRAPAATSLTTPRRRSWSCTRQFDSYGRAGYIVGIAAGLCDMGAHYVGPAGDETDGARTAQPAGAPEEPLTRREHLEPGAAPRRWRSSVQTEPDQKEGA